MEQISSPSQILKDLENVYALALQKGNFTAALKAKELLGREYGLFSSASQKRKFSLEELSDEELDSLIKKIEIKIGGETKQKEFDTG